jgi:hypothetical protein
LEAVWQHAALSVGQRADRPKAERLKGLSPVKRANRKDDTVKLVEVNTSINANGKKMIASSGSETLACLTLGVCGNPGGPALSSCRREYAGQLKREEGK